MIKIKVPSVNEYEVLVGNNLVAEIYESISKYRNAVIFAAPTMVTTARSIQLQASDSAKIHIVQLPDGEKAKTITELSSCWDELAKAHISRSDLVVGIGGGSVTDLVGFAAATWMRGVDFISIPTTVLGMVDAAIGGKTGVNTDHGKNLVGVFSDPVKVICNLDFLVTLPPVDIYAGFAEIAKCGFISDLRILELIESDTELATNPNSAEFMDLISRAIAVKVETVKADRLEKSLTGVGRAALNYGHTLGHAIEKQSGYRWRHGEAISIGMIFAAELAKLVGLLEEDDVNRHYAVLNALNLPTSYEASNFEDLLPIMRLDKKTSTDIFRFVLLEQLGQPVFVDNLPTDTLLQAFTKLKGD